MAKSNFSVDTSGLKKLKKDLNKVSNKANNINGQTVPLENIFTPKFMKQYTKFNSIDEFFQESPFTLEKQEDLEQIDEKALDEYVRQNSSFISWDDLKARAGEIYVANQLGF